MFFLKKPNKLFIKIYNGKLENIEEAISELRTLGLNQAETVKLIYKEAGFPLREADHLVLYSPTWKDKLEDNIDLRNEFYDYLSNYERFEKS